MNEKAKILILDDEPIVCERLKASLESAGFIADAFVSSTDAIASLAKRKYDILITDLKMSGPDGMQVVREAKRVNPEIKPIIITGFATKETAAEAKRMGAVEFIAKPFRMNQLRNLVEMLLTNPNDVESR